MKAMHPHSTGLRFFLFEADGTLRRLPKRTVDGMVRGEDRMMQYAGQRLHTASAWLLLDNGAPAELLKVEGSWWKFDAQGRTGRPHGGDAQGDERCTRLRGRRYRGASCRRFQTSRRYSG